MDGASKFVRGDAIAGLIITAVNIFGGIIIGVTRHGMTLGEAADVFTKLSVGDGLVTQIPALIVSLAAGLLVSKGGTRGAAEKAILGQLGYYPRALMVASVLMGLLALVPGLPFLPFFAVLGVAVGVIAYTIPRNRAAARAPRPGRRSKRGRGTGGREPSASRSRNRCASSRSSWCSASRLAAAVSHSRATSWRNRVQKMRRRFASQLSASSCRKSSSATICRCRQSLRDQDARHHRRHPDAAARRPPDRPRRCRPCQTFRDD